MAGSYKQQWDRQQQESVSGRIDAFDLSRHVGPIDSSWADGPCAHYTALGLA